MNTKKRLKADIERFKEKKELTPFLFFCNNAGTTWNISAFCSQYRKSPYAVRRYIDSPSALYYNVYRLWHTLQNEGLTVLDKRDKAHLWATARKELFDLLKQVQNSNNAKPPKKKPFALPSKARPERIEAIKETLKTDMLTLSEKEIIQDHFMDYINDINNRAIVLERIMDLDEYGQRYFFLDYQTRFNSKARKAGLLDTYETTINETLTMFSSAIHLVLTTDPKKHKSLWHANRHFSIAWNKFLSWLTRKLKYRPLYLTVYEFTKSGLLHAHILIFGRSYLLPHHEITEEWQKCGQGSYNFIYALQNINGAWHYKRQRPNDAAKGQSAEDYLKKYLKKAQYDDNYLNLYWTFNKRFFTMSRALQPGTEKDTLPSGIFRYLGSYNIFNIPAWITENIPTMPDTRYKPPPLYTHIA